MIQKRLEDITKSDIESLIEDKVPESKTLDYKRQLHGGTDRDKKEFLADVVSFANAAGGDILFGMDEGKGKEKGIATKVVPIKSESADDAILKLEGTIRNGIDPKLHVQSRAIPGWGEDGTEYVLVIRIPQSVSAPHMVTYGNTSRFFTRNSTGKVQLDVHEIREAFLANEFMEKRIREFVQERLGNIQADETPVKLSSERRIVLHMVPMRLFSSIEKIAPTKIAENSHDIIPIHTSGSSTQYNLDGYLIHDTDHNSRSRSYVQLFRTGALEAVQADIIIEDQSELWLPISDLEKEIIKSFKSFVKYFISMDIIDPIIVIISLLNFKGVKLGVNYRSDRLRKHYAINVNNIIFPEIIIRDIYNSNIDDGPKMLKPLFDTIWNTFGFAQSQNFDNNGNWNPRR